MRRGYTLVRFGDQFQVVFPCTLYLFHTYARMLRIAADALSVVIRKGSVLYAYCIRTVSVDFRRDPP